MAADKSQPPQSTTPQPAPKQAPNPPQPTTSPLSTIPIPQAFTHRKRRILAALAVPDDEYTDLSPKGTVDAGIRELISELNGVDGFVTTSSCAGRVSVFLEGRRQQGGVGGVLPGHHFVAAAEDEEGGAEDAPGRAEVDEDAQRSSSTVAGVGGKGGGGKWLFVSHEPVETKGKLDSEPNIVAALLGMEEPIFSGVEGGRAKEMGGGEMRLIHFKFEPMILHILTASPHHAQLILRCGLQAGFRESGAINLIPPPSSSSSSAAAAAAATPIVAIRSMGLGLESLIGTETNGIKHCTVSGEYLQALIAIANERFGENARRIARFRGLLRAELEKGRGKQGPAGWEDAEVRKERKRAEGLRRAEEVRSLRGELEGEQPWGLEEAGGDWFGGAAVSS